MWQLYIYFDADNKWDELYDTYELVVTRVAAMKPELEAASSFTLSINDPSGTQIQSVNK